MKPQHCASQLFHIFLRLLDIFLDFIDISLLYIGIVRSDACRLLRTHSTGRLTAAVIRLERIATSFSTGAMRLWVMSRCEAVEPA